MRLWGGRFEGSTDERMADFTRSLEIDQALALDDLAGSAAHVRGLGRAGLLRPDEVEALLAGLDGLRGEVEAGTLAWNPALEDVHMNLEEALSLRIGAVAGKLHTGRSRNDQVATDLRLWTRRTVDALDAALVRMERALVGLADREGTPSCPAPPTSSPPSRSSSPTTSSPTSRCSSATGVASPTAAAGRTSAHWARARWPAPAIRWTARRPLASSASTASPRTPWTRSPIATSLRSSSSLPPSRWSTCRAWPRRSPGGRTRGSASCGRPTPSRRALR